MGQNFFRIVGPGGNTLGETSNFTMVGRVFQGAMGGRVTVDRARYGRAAGSLLGKVDVFAAAFAAAQPRLPGAPTIGAVTPLLGFYPAACSVGAGGALGAPAGVPPVQMFSSASRHYGQMVGDIPANVCVQDYTARDPNGQIIPSFVQARVTDQVTISQALFDPANGGTLTVTAQSSDQNLRPVLTASIGGALTNNADGTAGLVAPNITVAPPMLSVTSAAGGRAELEIGTLEGQPGGGTLPFAGNDAFSLPEDSAATTFSVLANDTVGGVLIADTTPVTITIVTQPGLGVAIVNGRGIDFTPSPNANGSDLLTYTISVDGGVTISPAAFVAITITGVNDAPVAVGDVASGVGGLGISVNLLANDTDVDGVADLTGAVIVSAPVGVTYALVGGALSFTATAGTYVFTYQAKDVAGALSNVATATVTLTGGETLLITRAEYIAGKRRWRVDGTSTVLSVQTVYIMYANGTFADGTAAVGYLVGTSQVGATGLFLLDFALAGTNDPRNPTSTVFSVQPTRIYAITTLGGSSPTTPFVVR